MLSTFASGLSLAGALETLLIVLAASPVIQMPNWLRFFFWLEKGSKEKKEALTSIHTFFTLFYTFFGAFFTNLLEEPEKGWNSSGGMILWSIILLFFSTACCNLKLKLFYKKKKRN